MNFTSNIDYEALLNDVSRQMASSRLSRRQSRSSANARGAMTPKRHSAGIVKPVSAHNSPYGHGGRRRTTSAVRQYASLDDHYSYMFGAGDLHSNATLSEGPPPLPATAPPNYQPDQRPVSWHPRSTNTRHSTKRFSTNTDFSEPAVPPLTTFAQEDHTPVGSLTPAGLDFYNSSNMPSHEQMNQGYQPPRDLMWEQYLNSSNWTAMRQDMTYDKDEQSPQSDVARFSNGDVDGLLFSHPSSGYLWSHADSDADAAAAQSLMMMDDFLPIQRPATSEKIMSSAFAQPSTAPPPPSLSDENDDDDDQSVRGKELIGMGLYDDPEPLSDCSQEADGLESPHGTSMSTLISGGVAPSPTEGKGLKLEDAFEPPPDLGDDDDDAEGEDDEGNDADAEREEDMDMIAQAPAISDPSPLTSMAPTPVTTFPVHHHNQNQATNMAGQSFFFDDEGAASMFSHPPSSAGPTPTGYSFPNQHAASPFEGPSMWDLTNHAMVKNYQAFQQPVQTPTHMSMPNANHYGWI